MKAAPVRHNHLFNGCDRRIDVAAVDVSTNGIGIELHHRAPAAAIREKREPDVSVQQVLPCYGAPPELEATLA